MYFVAIESMNDGEVLHLVGPFEGTRGETWMANFVERAMWDADLVYILHAVEPSSPEVAELMEVS